MLLHHPFCLELISTYLPSVPIPSIGKYVLVANILENWYLKCNCDVWFRTYSIG